MLRLLHPNVGTRRKLIQAKENRTENACESERAIEVSEDAEEKVNDAVGREGYRLPYQLGSM